MDKVQILSRLCDYFRLPPEDITYVEQVEMLSIYRFVSQEQPGTLEHIIVEISRLHASIPGRGKRKRLHALFVRCQTRNIVECGRYDTQTLAAPVPYIYHRSSEY